MRSDQRTKSSNKRLAGKVQSKLAVVALALLFMTLSRMFAAHARGPNPPPGSHFTVTVTDDHDDGTCDGDCTLREAIQAANNTPTADTIDFTVTGTITLSTALPDISGDVEISGPGPNVLTIRRNDSASDFRIFTIVTSTGTFTFSGLALSNGSPGSNSAGGGILSRGTVNVTNCTISDSSALTGGGIANFGTLRLTNSKISHNRSNGGEGAGIDNHGSAVIANSAILLNSTDEDGGGIINQSTGSISITNSTINNNLGSESAGGILNLGSAAITNSTISLNSGFSGGGIRNGSNGTLSITNSTISGNRASADPSLGPGGGIDNRSGGTVTVKSSIIALNTAGLGPDIIGPFASQGFNLVGITDGSTGFTAPTDLTGTSASPLDPKLEKNNGGFPALKDNGGDTQTIALICGSPAIDKGSSDGLTGTLTTDQRGTGFPRTVDDPITSNATGGDGTDIGAFESVCNHPPVARCRNIQVSANDTCRAGITAAQVDDGSFDPDPGDSIAGRTVDNSGPLGLGPHTVTLTVTDTHGLSSSCMAMVTVVDTTPPQITCPANIFTSTANPGNQSVVVNYATASATDNCSPPTVVCSPPSGSQFPRGTTTVTCVATDAAANTASCSFTVGVFDVCAQDDSTHDQLMFDSQTGEYRFVRCGAGGFSVSGKGNVLVKGGTITLTDNRSDRRILVRIENSQKKGTATAQLLPQGTTYTIIDRNTADNSCACQ